MTKQWIRSSAAAADVDIDLTDDRLADPAASSSAGERTDRLVTAMASDVGMAAKADVFRIRE